MPGAVVQAWAWLWPGPRTPAEEAQQKQVNEAGLPQAAGLRRAGARTWASPAEAEPRIKEQPGAVEPGAQEAANPSPALSRGQT